MASDHCSPSSQSDLFFSFLPSTTHYFELDDDELELDDELPLLLLDDRFLCFLLIFLLLRFLTRSLSRTCDVYDQNLMKKKMKNVMKNDDIYDVYTVINLTCHYDTKDNRFS